MTQTRVNQENHQMVFAFGSWGIWKVAPTRYVLGKFVPSKTSNRMLVKNRAEWVMEGLSTDKEVVVPPDFLKALCKVRVVEDGRRPAPSVRPSPRAPQPRTATTAIDYARYIRQMEEASILDSPRGWGTSPRQQEAVPDPDPDPNYEPDREEEE